MLAEQSGHEKHDELVSPRAIPKTDDNSRIEIQGRKEEPEAEEDGRQGEAGEEESDDPLDAVLPGAVRSLGGDLLGIKEGSKGMIEQGVTEEEAGIDQHPDKGLVSGSSKDGLGHEEATEEEGRSEEGEEGRVPRKIQAPVYVSKVEREEHELTHTPYRSWCDHCVRCRGRNTQHRKAGKEEKKSDVSRVAFDYFFMSHQDETANEHPMLIMVDEGTGDKCARAVGQKGLGGWVRRDAMACDRPP